MNPSLFADLPPMIQLHAGTALAAALLGPFVLLRNRRDMWHRGLGYVWVVLMVVVALSSFFVHTLRMIGPFGPIHLLSIYTLYALARAIQAARARRFADHRLIMRQIYFLALAAAGVLALLPGRALHAVVFGRESWGGFVALAVVVALASVLALRPRPRPV